MKTILLSTKSKWCCKIGNREKKIEVRKSAPKEVPFKVLLYCTKSKPYIGSHTENGKRVFTNRTFTGESYYNGKVIGEFVCYYVEDFDKLELYPHGEYREYEQMRLDKFLKDSCLTYEEVCGYRKNIPYYKPLYAWHISDLKIYDKPKELSEFGVTRAPQSWVYVKGEQQ